MTAALTHDENLMNELEALEGAARAANLSPNVHRVFTEISS